MCRGLFITSPSFNILDSGRRSLNITFFSVPPGFKIPHSGVRTGRNNRQSIPHSILLPTGFNLPHPGEAVSNGCREQSLPWKRRAPARQFMRQIRSDNVKSHFFVGEPKCIDLLTSMKMPSWSSSLPAKEQVCLILTYETASPVYRRLNSPGYMEKGQGNRSSDFPDFDSSIQKLQ